MAVLVGSAAVTGCDSHLVDGALKFATTVVRFTAAASQDTSDETYVPSNPPRKSSGSVEYNIGHNVSNTVIRPSVETV